MNFDTYLKLLLNTEVTIFFSNSYRLFGTLKGYDDSSILLETTAYSAEPTVALVPIYQVTTVHPGKIKNWPLLILSTSPGNSGGFLFLYSRTVLWTSYYIKIHYCSHALTFTIKKVFFLKLLFCNCHYYENVEIYDKMYTY